MLWPYRIFSITYKLHLLLKKIKDYINTRINLDSANRKFYLITFSAFVAFVFLNFYEPFGLYYDQSITQEDIFVKLSLAVFVAYIVLLLLQFVVRELFKVNNFNLLTLVLWFLFESITVASVWFVLDLITGDYAGTLIDVWLSNFLGYVLIFAVPYFLYTAYVYFGDRIKKLSDENAVDGLCRDFVLKDENEKTILTLNVDNLLFIQSADNYVEVNYLKNDKVVNELLRNSLKNVEKVFTNSSVLRCHRSYIINTQKVELARITNSGYQIRLDRLPELTIPVSKSYISELKKHLH